MNEDKEFIISEEFIIWLFNNHGLKVTFDNSKPLPDCIASYIAQSFNQSKENL